MLRVGRMFACLFSLIKVITLKVCRLCFVLMVINNIILNLFFFFFFFFLMCLDMVLLLEC